MKIGLLTYHWVPNFGAQLQTLSTYKYLEKNGYSPIILNWIPEDARTYYNRVMSEQRLYHEKFITGNCILTEEFSDFKHMLKIIENNGVTHVVIGSDSLFNIYKPSINIRTFKRNKPTSDHKFPNPFWGYGLESIPHVGVSISCQNAKYQDFKKEAIEIGKTLGYFNAITVRDEWTQSMVSYFTNGNIVPNVTPDPVFAFNENVPQCSSKKDVLSRFNLPEKYILFSFSKGRMSAPKKWIKNLVYRFHQDGYKCIELGKIGGQHLQMDGEVALPLDPMDWYNLIKYSSAYIGVLMHPIVVCLHNSVPFFSFDHYGTGPILFSKKSSSKIFDVLKRADLLDYHFFQRNHLIFPSSKEVYDLIMRFPTQKCREFSKKQQKSCLENMNNVITELING